MEDKNNFLECYKSLDEAINLLDEKSKAYVELTIRQALLKKITSPEEIIGKFRTKNEAIFKDELKKLAKNLTIEFCLRFIVALIVQILLIFFGKFNFNIYVVLGTTLGTCTSSFVEGYKKYKKIVKNKKELEQYNIINDGDDDLSVLELIDLSREKQQVLKAEINELSENIAEYKKLLEDLSSEFAEEILKEHNIDVNLKLDVHYKKLDLS